jgi:hypothetical protein
MGFDLQTIKETLSLVDLFERDGHALRRSGSNHFAHCPFHEEKSGSCKVTRDRFICFGCKASGDVFDYWERSRGLSKKDAIEELARLAGVSPDIAGFHKPRTKPKPKPKKKEVIQPLEPELLEKWHKNVTDLAENPRQQAYIAAWRGYQPETVAWAVDHGILGFRWYYGAWREAFLVEAPEAPSGPFVPVSVHIRLAPDTKGNERPKQSWHFSPKGRGAWPLVIGNPSEASTIFMVEGQWDGLALVDIMRWYRQWPPTVCVIALRGATSFEKLLSHYALSETATAFAIADADFAGAQWFEPGGLIERLAGKVARTFAFWPGRPKADLNDLLKDGLTRADMLKMIKPKLPDPRYAKPTGPTFLAWCKLHKEAPGGIGRAAKTVIADKDRPKGRCPLHIWSRRWEHLNLSADLVSDLHTAWDQWVEDCRTNAPIATPST